ncbi:hypothetical protein chiPu_0029856 [Chiloscyllium punctatum]|uniref:Secreted protein n=1 Tax=Chiloscyllium punctatum TaxID=137246 RepID=A0A401TSD8_CHIPU|nr:hypothetical protein [Chiloscyllium punctatum]
MTIRRVTGGWLEAVLLTMALLMSWADGVGVKSTWLTKTLRKRFQNQALELFPLPSCSRTHGVPGNIPSDLHRMSSSEDTPSRAEGAGTSHLFQLVRYH